MKTINTFADGINVFFFIGSLLYGKAAVDIKATLKPHADTMKAFSCSYFLQDVTQFHTSEERPLWLGL